MSAPQTGKAVPDAPHGTLAGFQTWGCRCMFCRSAKAAITPTVSGASSAGKPCAADTR